MPDFPLLKTGAVTQYPVECRAGYDTAVIRFLDGSEQRFPVQARAQRRWLLDFSNIDDTEARRLEKWFAGMEGAFGSFAFPDPASGEVFADCSIENQHLVMDALREGRLAVRIVVRQNL